MDRNGIATFVVPAPASRSMVAGCGPEAIPKIYRN
jgi:hypothetical protein